MREPTRPATVLLLMGLPLVFVIIVGVITLVHSGGAPTAATPAPAARQTPQATAQALVPFGDCTSAQFGTALPPIDPPADPHHYASAPPMTIDTSKLYEATVTTNRGAFTVCLAPKLAPQSVNAFVTLARNHYYDKSQILIAGPDPTNPQVPPLVLGGNPNCSTTAQTPCPVDAAGFAISQEQVRQRYVRGAIAFDATQSGGSSVTFFVVKQDMTALVQVDGKGNAFNVFGNVASGMNVVDALQPGDIITSITVAEQS